MLEISKKISHIFIEKPAFKWTQAVQTHVIQESAVVHFCKFWKQELNETMGFGVQTSWILGLPNLLAVDSCAKYFPVSHFPLLYKRDLCQSL